MNSSRIENLVRTLCIVIIALSCVGLLFIYSSSCVFAQLQHQDSLYFVKRQAIGLVLGIIVAIIASNIPAWMYYRFAVLLWLCALLATICTLIPGLGKTIHGSSRWFVVGPFSMQPSEWLRCGCLLVMAKFLSRYEGMPRHVLWRYGLFLVPVLLSALVLLGQPDFGMAVTIVATGFVLLLIAYPDWYYTVGLMLSALPVAALLIIAKPYRMRRLLTFLDPWSDPKGAGFQVIQSLIAIGTGGVFGVGIGNSRQKFLYLPMQHTDFIIAIITEEVGFLGAALLLLTYLVILWLTLKIAFQVHGFARYVTLGFGFMVTLQAGINASVALGMVPTKGIGLPFVSYGNSFLISLFALLGVIRSLVREQRVS